MFSKILLPFVGATRYYLNNLLKKKKEENNVVRGWSTTCRRFVKKGLARYKTRKMFLFFLFFVLKSRGENEMPKGHGRF